MNYTEDNHIALLLNSIREWKPLIHHITVEPDTFFAATAALVTMGLAGELAAPKAGGPGTFRSHLLDAVVALDEKVIVQGQKVSFE